MYQIADGPVLQLHSVSKTYGDVVAVRAVTETIGRGEYFCIVGPSGCGKTTLLRLIAGFDHPTTGDVVLGSRTITQHPPERRDVNMVFQSYALFPHMTVRQNVEYGLRMRRTPGEQIQRKVGEILELVNLSGEAGRYPRELSGGQQQRVALARALVNQPQVVLLDEPLSALDKNLRLAMQEELRRIQRDVGITFLHVTHDQSEALGMADRVAVMNDGAFVQVGPPREVYRRPVGRFVAEFLGWSNILAGTVDQRQGWVILDGGARLRVSDAADAAPGARTGVLLRPESIELHAVRPPNRENVLEGTVVDVNYLGPITDCRVRTQGNELRVSALSRAFDGQAAPSGQVFLAVAPTDVMLLPDE